MQSTVFTLKLKRQDAHFPPGSLLLLAAHQLM